MIYAVHVVSVQGTGPMVLHYGPTLCLSLDTHIHSNLYRVVYFWVFLTKKTAQYSKVDDYIKIRAYVSI